MLIPVKLRGQATSEKPVLKCNQCWYTFQRNVSDTHSNTHFSTHYLWLVKSHMGPTKSCGSHINLEGPIWILTNQKKCVEKCMLECVLLTFLYISYDNFKLANELLIHYHNQ